MIDKFLAFEFVVKNFLQWKSELVRCPLEAVKLSKTQSLKLLFLVAAVPNADGRDLLDVFNNFYAMQFGPVESDILNGFSENDFCFLERNESLLSAPSRDNDAFSPLNENGINARICESVRTLRSINPNLVRYPATMLVEVTHKWWCWKQTFHVAKLLDRGSMLMSVDSIRQSNKVFVL